MYNRVEERNKTLEEKGFNKTLNYFCSINDVEKVKEKLQSIKPTDLNKKLAFYGTPLHIACSDNNIELVKLLLDAGADTEIKDVSGNTALAIALSNGYEELAHLLLNNGADIQEIGVHRTTALHQACMRCSSEMISFLIGEGLDVNALASDKRSTLLYTTGQDGGNIEAAKVLLANGIAPEHISPVFNEACWRGNADIAQLLLEHGAGKNVLFGKTGKKPETLFWICNKGTCMPKLRERYAAVIQLLLNEGIDFTIHYKFKGLLRAYDASPLDMAINSGFKEAEEIISKFSIV